MKNDKSVTRRREVCSWKKIYKIQIRLFKKNEVIFYLELFKKKFKKKLIFHQ